MSPYGFLLRTITGGLVAAMLVIGMVELSFQRGQPIWFYLVLVLLGLPFNLAAFLLILFLELAVFGHSVVQHLSLPRMADVAEIGWFGPELYVAFLVGAVINGCVLAALAISRWYEGVFSWDFPLRRRR